MCVFLVRFLSHHVASKTTPISDAVMCQLNDAPRVKGHKAIVHTLEFDTMLALLFCIQFMHDIALTWDVKISPVTDAASF